MRFTLRFLILALLPLSVLAAEEIISFHSDITINSDGSLNVVESIQVRAEGQKIKRGIYRDFPTRYRDSFGNISRVGFEVLSVQRGQNDEPFHSQSVSNGVRIYIGEQQTLLEPGEYLYRIEYRTTRQLGFFDRFDELYWNVTGNGWDFPIRMASASVTLPQAVTASDVTMTGYTGLSGSTERFLTSRVVDERRFDFETTQALAPTEGLTIVLTWPKGLVQEPDASTQREQFIDDNRHSLIAVAGLAGVLVYYLLVWLKVGKDPARGVIMPLYQAPHGFSPASTRFISRMDYDKTCFTTALVSLAVKGAISIEQDSADRFTVIRSGKPFDAAPGEQIIMDRLFVTSDRIDLTRTEHKRIREVMQHHESSLRDDFEKLYFVSNRRYFTPGIMLSIAAIGFSFSRMADDEILFSTLFVGMFTLIPFLILATSYKRLIKRRNMSSVLPIAVQLLITGAFFALAGDALRQLLAELDLVSWPVLISAYGMLAANILFEQWLKAPTLAGRKLLDRIEGLKLYLDVAEADTIAQQGQPEMSTDIYERFLPFAIALGVSHAWSRQLDHAIANGLVATDYQPRGIHFYRGHDSAASFANSLAGNFDSAVSAASTAPGSTSGSSGGSSGGGGGGGGGGGW